MVLVDYTPLYNFLCTLSSIMFRVHCDFIVSVLEKTRNVQVNDAMELRQRCMELSNILLNTCIDHVKVLSREIGARRDV